MVNQCDTLILSDLHLGSEVSRAKDATHLIESIDFRQLILLGDIFCNLNFARLTSSHWSFLSRIRKLSNPKRRKRVIWVEGNHDEGLSQVMSHLVGIPVYQRYVWEFGGLRHLAIHGHQFDSFIHKNAMMSSFFVQFYRSVQRLDTKGQRISRSLDRLSTRWLRLDEKVEQGAYVYAQQGHADRIFCGHTHLARQSKRRGISYYNSGSWQDRRATYITVDREGVLIHEYQGGTYHHHSSEERSDAPAAPTDILVPAGLPGYAGYKSLRC